MQHGEDGASKKKKDGASNSVFLWLEKKFSLYSSQVSTSSTNVKP